MEVGIGTGKCDDIDRRRSRLGHLDVPGIYIPDVTTTSERYHADYVTTKEDPKDPLSRSFYAWDHVPIFPTVIPRRILVHFLPQAQNEIGLAIVQNQHIQGVGCRTSPLTVLEINSLHQLAHLVSE